MSESPRRMSAAELISQQKLYLPPQLPPLTVVAPSHRGILLYWLGQIAIQLAAGNDAADLEAVEEADWKKSKGSINRTEAAVLLGVIDDYLRIFPHYAHIDGIQSVKAKLIAGMGGTGA